MHTYIMIRRLLTCIHAFPSPRLHPQLSLCNCLCVNYDGSSPPDIMMTVVRSCTSRPGVLGSSPRHPPALRTSSPIGPTPFPHSGVSRSSSAPTGPNSRPCVALCRHALRGAAPAPPASTPQGNSTGLHSPSGYEFTGGASRQRQGP